MLGNHSYRPFANLSESLVSRLAHRGSLSQAPKPPVNPARFMGGRPTTGRPIFDSVWLNYESRSDRSDG
jgi:hypothetical protein